MLPNLEPKHLRSRALKSVYERWKKEDKVHTSESGLTAHYIMHRASEEGIDFVLTYNSTFECYRISRNI